MNDNLKPFKLGTWIRVYTNALMMDQDTMIGYVTEYGKCDFGPTVTIKSDRGGCEVPLAYVVGLVDLQRLEANLLVIQKANLDIDNLVPCIVPHPKAPIVAVIRPDREWWTVREGEDLWRTRTIATRGILVAYKRALVTFPELKSTLLVYKTEE